MLGGGGELVPHLAGVGQLRLEHANLPGSVLGRRRIGGGCAGLVCICGPVKTQPANFRFQFRDSLLQVRVPVVRGRGASCIPTQKGDYE